MCPGSARAPRTTAAATFSVPRRWNGIRRPRLAVGVVLLGVRRRPRAPAIVSLLVLLALAVVPSTTTSPTNDSSSFVDPLIGTAGNGHTFPGAAVPFGMVQFSPVTVDGGPGGYSYGGSRISGFALTRMSGAGCTNYGDVPLMPETGPPQVSPAQHPGELTSGFSHTDEVARPGSYQLGLRSGISASLAATTRTGVASFAYPAWTGKGTLLIEPSASANPTNATIHLVGDRRVAGSATSAAFGGGCGHPRGEYTVHFALEFAQPFVQFGMWSKDGIDAGLREETGPNVGAYVTFDTRDGRAVGVKVGISFVSSADAFGNLAAAPVSWDVTRVAALARARWDDLLGRIQVRGGSSSRREVFYTALYHTLLHPNVFSDANGRYMSQDGKVLIAAGYEQYTNFSEWDTYRGETQLLALLAPHQTSDMIRSLLADGQQTGQLPRWLVANAETGLMNGDPADPLIADAYAFGAQRFNARLALREMMSGAGVRVEPGARVRTSAARGYVERPGLASYLKRGYVPVAASATLEYALDDFAISQLAGALGERGDQALMLGRSANWRHTFEQRTGFVEPRLGTGSFPRHVSPTSAVGFTEGDAWQYTFMVPQDMGGLLAAIGPPARVVRRLDSFFAQLNSGPNARHAWLGNEPSLTAPYAYLWLRAPSRSEKVVRRALATLFAATPSGLPGNDDLGTLSAWYVWNALGLYPAIPGVGGLSIVGPLFSSATIALPSGSRLEISSSGGSGPFVRSLSLDGRRYDSSWLPIGRIADGGRLQFTLGRAPSDWATARASTPPSFEPTAVR
jgi:predicted alpha-1,2-mannosidase